MMNLMLILSLSVLISIAVPATALDEFIISYWCGPLPNDNLDARYAEVAECNFTHAMPPCAGVTVEQNKAILDACAKHGLKYIIPDARILAKEPNDPDFTSNLDAVIADYSNHPATAGYFITDEPNSSAFPKLAAINQYLTKKDPKHMPFINLFPNYASEAQLGNKTYEEHVEQFCTLVKPRILSYDHYIMMACDPENPTNLGSFFHNLEVVRAAGLKYGVPTCFIMLVTPHGQYRNPTEDDLRWQIYNALAYGYKAILYFTYWTPHDEFWNFHNGILDEKGNRTEHFNQSKRINGELKVLGKVLVKLTSTGVYHSGDVPSACKPLSPDLPISVTSELPTVLGIFRHEDGSTWAMVVNRNLRKDSTVILSFKGSIKNVEEMSSKTGAMHKLKLDKGKTTIHLRPGEGRLLKLLAK
ncbi:MAG: hypothetical protein QHH26_09495 [Armatimonadota bacterium]|nr:hypothetical protein [Armatimonadota bacterium]